MHLEINTITPNDFSYWEPIDEVVQREPAGAGDPEIMGQLAAVGIRKGEPFAPDERMREILEEAIAVGNATARTLSFAPRESEGMAYYPGSAWFNMLWAGGYEFLTPPPEITPDGVKQSPSDGARKLNARIVFFYPATGITPAMCMRLTGMGSQYLMASKDADGEYLDGARELPAQSARRHSRESLLVGDGVRPPDPVDAAERAEVPQPRQPVRHSRAERRRLDRHLLRPRGAGRGRSTTGSGPTPARAGSRSSASTARSSRSSTRAGVRARSRR